LAARTPAAPADGNAGNPADPQASDPGREPDAHETPEQDDSELEARTQEGEGDGEPPSPDGEPAADPAAKANAEPQPKPKSRYQQRVERLVQERDAAVRRAEHYEGMAKKHGTAKPLDPLAFRSDADYQRALIKDTSREQRAEFARSEAESAAQQAQVVEQQIWDARVADYREQVPDFEQVAYSNGVTYSQHGIKMLRQHPSGPQLAYYLGKNSAEAQRIANLSPLETAFELGSLSERLKGPPRKVVSKAPNPVPTVRGRTAATGFQPDSDDIDGYFAWRDKLQ
jgi:hypothetical protein